MAEKRRGKKRKEEIPEKIPPEEYGVAKYLRQKLPPKKTTLFNHKVDYFVASKAIDCLLDSKWAQKGKSPDVLFTTRESVVDYLNMMLIHKFFHRARKVQVPVKDSKKKKDESSDEKESKSKQKKKKDDEATDSKSKKDKKKDDDDKKKKKKVKLDMHLDQIFVDGNEVFVWIYDPIPTKTWFIGGFLVIGVILLCLFPLWPQSVRKGVYYLSIAAAGFLFFIIALAVFRLLAFCVVWALTFGRHHLWILPNLTEDVGFFESFWPLYKYEYRGKASEEKSEKNEKSEKEAKDDKEEEAKEEAGDSKRKEKSKKKRTVVKSSATDTDHNSEDNEFEVLDASEAHEDESEDEDDEDS